MTVREKRKGAILFEGGGGGRERESNNKCMENPYESASL